MCVICFLSSQVHQMGITNAYLCLSPYVRVRVPGLCSSVSGHDYKGFICGPCQTNGSWRLSPGRVPWPLPGSTVASGAPVPGIFRSAAKHQRKSPPSSFTFIKTVAPGSPRALGGCAKPAAADKLGPPLTAHLLCFLLIFPVPLSV